MQIFWDKHFYAYARSKLKTKSGIADLEDGNKFARSNEDKATTLNNFFFGVFTKENLENIPAFDDRHFQESLSDISFTKEDVLQKLKSLKINKSPWPDGHHLHVLKEVAEVLADPLTLVLNKILSTGPLPQLWKDANVTPIFKQGKKSSPGNYRPVSLTSVICKLME